MLIPNSIGMLIALIHTADLDCVTAILLFSPKFHEKKSLENVTTVQSDRLLTALSLASRKSDSFGTVSSILLICKLRSTKVKWLKSSMYHL